MASKEEEQARQQQLDNSADPVVRAAAERAGVDPRIARALLREQYDQIDPLVPQLLAAVRDRGGAECWHKHSSFLSHLTGTWAIAALWGLPREVQLCALLHSAYSNSFVNLALFSPDEKGRKVVREMAGDEVERWTWLFCRVPRNELIYDRLVDPICYADGAAVTTTTSSAPDYSPDFPESITVADIRDGSPIKLDAYEVGVLLALTILDFSEQWHSWQDGMFATLEDQGGRMRYSGKRAHHLWPGPSKPGLYLHTLSLVGRLVVAANAKLEQLGDPRRVPLPKPWASCSYVVSREAQLQGRDLYWRAVTELFDAGAAEFQSAEEAADGDAAKAAALWIKGEEREREAESVLRQCAKLLPCVGEPRVVLAQLLLQRAVRLSSTGDGKGDGKSDAATVVDACWQEAGELAVEGLSLLLTWCTPWDKRFPFGAWCAWARVCAGAAKKREWPRNDEPLKVINLGLV
jgi:hypothetical protein